MTEETTFTKEQLDAAIAEATKEANGRVDAMDAKINELLGEKKAAAAKAKEAEDAAAAATEEAARKKGDIEALEKSWADKLANATSDKDATISAQQKAIESLTIGAKASAIASELAVQGSATVLERIVKERLSVEMTDDGPLVRVVDASGKPSAASIEDLKAELQADAALKPLLVGSKASGGGAAGANGSGGGAKASGNIGGDRSERIAAFRAKFPELNA